MPFRPVVNPAAGRPDELFICLHIATLPAINQSPGLCPGLASSLGRPCPSVSGGGGTCRFHRISRAFRRSEEHTSELQSLMRISYAVFCLKKKNTINKPTNLTQQYTTPLQYYN